MNQSVPTKQGNARTRRELAQDLKTLGVAQGDVLWVHSSLRAIGPVEGGADAVIDALLDAVGPLGTVLMPAFNLVPRAQRATSWHYPDTPSTTGYITERFRLRPGTRRSDHYSHSVAANGANASWFVDGHREMLGFDSPWDLAPWGRTFGSQSPFMRVYQSHAKVLMLGVDYHSATFKHLVEVLAHHHELINNPNAIHDYLDPDPIAAWWDARGAFQSGPVGLAPCKLFPVAKFVDELLAESLARPFLYFESQMKSPARS